MNKKPLVFCSKPLGAAMQRLSKNQLIDLVVDLSRGELGEEADDKQVLAWVQAHIETVWQHRGDRPISLAVDHDNFVKASDEYRRKMQG